MRTQIIVSAVEDKIKIYPNAAYQSKCLSILNGKPIIYHVIDNILDNINDIVNIIIVERDDMDDVTSYINEKYSQNKNIKVIKQNNCKNSRVFSLSSALSYISLYCDIQDTDKVIFWPSTYITSIDNKEIINGNYILKDDDAKIIIFNDFAQINDYIERPFYVQDDIRYLYNFNEFIELFKKSYNIDFLENNIDIINCSKLNLYYRAKAKMLSNTKNKFHVDFDTNIIYKEATGDNAHKLEKEFMWYQKLSDLQKFAVPKCFNINSNSNDIFCYGMSYETGTQLNDLWLYSSIYDDEWKKIIIKLIDYHYGLFNNSNKISPFSDFSELYIDTILDFFEKNKDLYSELIDYDDVKNNLEKIGNYINSNSKAVELIHGDLHFGNILYDTYLGKFTFIDPKGNTNIADLQYEYAKIYSDIYVDVPLILSGNYTLMLTEPVISEKFNRKKELVISAMDDKMISLGLNTLSLKLLGCLIALMNIKNFDNHKKALVIHSYKKLKELSKLI